MELKGTTMMCPSLKNFDRQHTEASTMSPGSWNDGGESSFFHHFFAHPAVEGNFQTATETTKHHLYDHHNDTPQRYRLVGRPTECNRYTNLSNANKDDHSGETRKDVVHDANCAKARFRFKRSACRSHKRWLKVILFNNVY
mmetsp:Transcript_15149/g.21123  ORF Transcript_15149/g.21123 Transcript_15149/m.21123 type:complete len:141 (+) Transcript_15149:160-582(+)